MKIFVNTIPPGGMDIEERLDPSSLNMETEHIQFTQGLNVKAHIERDRDILTVNCKVSSASRRECGRCLSEVDVPIVKHMNFIYDLSGEYSIELNDRIRDEIILDYPLKILCSPNCKGLCLKCGKNLNGGPCECEL